jgi:ATP-binding cassette subfamily A (ABC1) protein 3
MKGGEVSSLIDSLSAQVRSYGGNPQLFDKSEDLALTCRTGTSGGSPCYAAVVFHSSPSEGADSSAGTWNYTLRSVGSSWGGGFADIRSSINGPQGSLLPLQRAVDQEITKRSQSTETSQLADANIILFTDQDQSALDKSRTSNYLSMAIYVFGPVFVFTLIDIVYHMTSFVARERELGMSGLIDTMISGGSSVRGSLVRQIATYLSFTAIYLPSWLAVGIVVSVVIFPVKSRGLPTGFFILAGLSFTSFSLFGASFFKKAQLSGSILVVIIIVGAILPVVLGGQNKTISAVLSVLFPSSNLSYFITAIGKFEAANKRVSMTKSALDADDKMADKYRLPLYAHWVIVVVHIVVFPVLAFAVEHLFHSTASKHRRFAQPASPGDPTVILTGFSKT